MKTLYNNFSKEKYLNKLMKNRDEIFKIQKNLIQKYNMPIISFMLNIPGIKKNEDIFIKFHNIYIKKIKNILIKNDLEILEEFYKNEITGMIFICVINCNLLNKNTKNNAQILKKMMMKLENTYYGRILDIDVFDENFNIITRESLNLNSRKCILCENDAIFCIKNQIHNIIFLKRKVLHIVKEGLKMNENILKIEASCGTSQSGDCLVLVAPNDDLNIELNSSVEKQFGKQIIKSIKEVLDEEHIENAYIKLNDKGALDYVIRARLKSAIYRSMQKDYNWDLED